ncbi:MAG: type II toxin-antitoxin system HipA family toxin [Xanthomonadales bacterium]|nr:type II toxin-antitoxin system HipA family toxin [Xanthomonadales bacterium]
MDERIQLLQVHVAGRPAGQLLQQSGFEYRYLTVDPAQPVVGLLMPPTRLTWQDGALFPVMDQNLPEGDLFNRLRQQFPKQPMTAMRLLALIGDNGIGRLGYRIPGSAVPAQAAPITRQTLLRMPFTARVFDDLIDAYLATGIGVAGMQPKIMVPERATIPIPNLIVKTAGAGYPGLAANEYLCMMAALRAGIDTAQVELSDDGQMLLVERFDLDADGQRLGFEDVASLMGLRVRDTLSERKYHGSYQRVAELLGMITGNRHDLHRFYEQLAFSIMVGNGDAHLKNFGVLYHGVADGIRLAPMFDVVTTRIYRYQRSPGGPELEDSTMALRLWSGKTQRSRGYPVPEALCRFGRDVCGVRDPKAPLERIAQAMADTLRAASKDPRIPASLLAQLRRVWENGIRCAQ